jgi:16S rRNA (guanine(966)-N(2))-methyltransferase RsmD
MGEEKPEEELAGECLLESLTERCRTTVLLYDRSRHIYAGSGLIASHFVHRSAVVIMRVIAGSAKGRVLAVPKGGPIRPTAQYVKEAIFSILAAKVDKAVVLDLFAGSGSLGIEALSRGAAECVLVDNDQRCVRTIKRNLEFTQLSDRARVYRMNVYKAVDALNAEGRQFDIVFADPPYEGGHEQLLLARLSELRILRPSATVVLEHSCRTETPVRQGCLARESLRTYGDTHVSLYVCMVEGQE